MKCPTCQKETESAGNPHRPFCSERCKLLDLARWVDGEFRIAGDPVAPDADDPDQPAPTES